MSAWVRSSGRITPLIVTSSIGVLGTRNRPNSGPKGMMERKNMHGNGKDVKSFSTVDGKLAAVLKYAGYELTRAENEILDTRYHYNDPGDIKDVIRDYEAGQQGVADARSLLNVYEELRQGPEPKQESQLTGPAIQKTRNQCIATLATYFGATLMRIDPVPNTHHGMLFTLDLSMMAHPVDLSIIDTWFYASGTTVDPKKFWDASCDVRDAVRNFNHFGRITYSIDQMRPKRYDPTGDTA